MYIPAYTSPALYHGRTFDLETSGACADVFPSSSSLPIKSINENQFSFKYQLIKSSKDINDLLDVSGELSLKIKANLLKVEGAGQYINESKLEEGTTSLLAVMKCTTVVDTIDGLVKPRESLIQGEFIDTLGSHYVRSITYGVEMVASLKFKSSSNSTKEQIKGNAEGELNVGAVNVGLRASLDKLSAECNDISDIAIKYYATDLPDKLPTKIEDLVLLIEEFPSRLKNLNDGKGIPISFELQPTKSIIPAAEVCLQQRALECDIDNLESCFDDLRTTKGLAEAYLQSKNGTDDDVQDFLGQINQIYQEFIEAISTMNRREGPDKVKACLKTYQDSLNGRNVPGKFGYKWKQILSGKQPVINPPEKESE